MNEKERMLSGRLYHSLKMNDGQWERSRGVLKKFNDMPFEQAKERMELLRGIFGQIGEDVYIEPPFYCDKGGQIHIGYHFYANTGFLALDEAKVTIGNHVMLGPRVCIYTACHPVDALIRNMHLEFAKPVTIGDDVWVGGNVVINPGVTIGSNVVIGSGSVVTKDIPDGVIAAGNPCRVIRKITDEDRRYWQEQADEYFADEDVREK